LQTEGKTDRLGIHCVAVADALSPGPRRPSKARRREPWRVVSERPGDHPGAQPRRLTTAPGRKTCPPARSRGAPRSGCRRPTMARGRTTCLQRESVEIILLRSGLLEL